MTQYKYIFWLPDGTSVSTEPTTGIKQLVHHTFKFMRSNPHLFDDLTSAMDEAKSNITGIREAIHFQKQNKKDEAAEEKRIAKYVHANAIKEQQAANREAKKWAREQASILPGETWPPKRTSSPPEQTQVSIHIPIPSVCSNKELEAQITALEQDLANRKHKTNQVASMKAKLTRLRRRRTMQIKLDMKAALK